MGDTSSAPGVVGGNLGGAHVGNRSDSMTGLIFVDSATARCWDRGLNRGTYSTDRGKSDVRSLGGLCSCSLFCNLSVVVVFSMALCTSALEQCLATKASTSDELMTGSRYFGGSRLSRCACTGSGRTSTLKRRRLGSRST